MIKSETSNQKPVTRMTIREFEFDFERLIVYQKTLMLIDKIFEIYPHTNFKKAPYNVL